MTDDPPPAYPPTREQYAALCAQLKDARETLDLLGTPRIDVWLRQIRDGWLARSSVPPETKGGLPTCRHCGKPTNRTHWDRGRWSCKSED